jgi:hypothetical protein
MPLLQAFVSIINKENADIIEASYRYVKQNFYRFSLDELRSIEKHYFLMSHKYHYDFAPILEKEINYVSNILKMGAKQTTTKYLEDYGMKEIPKHLQVTADKAQEKIQLFNNITNVKIVLYGLYHHDWEALNKARAIVEEKDPAVVFVEHPPQRVRVKYNAKELTDIDRIKRSLKADRPLDADFRGKFTGRDNEDYLITLKNQEIVKFLEQAAVEQKDKYQIEEAYRVVSGNKNNVLYEYFHKP